MAQSRDRPIFDEVQHRFDTMTTTMEELVSLLGSSYTSSTEGDSKDDSSHQEEDQLRFTNLFDAAQSDETTAPSIAFSSLSLDRDALQEQDDAKESSKSKDEVQHDTASLLARTMSLHETEEFHLVPSVILENFFSAFDTLVDARIAVYSKILSSHALSLAECNDDYSNNDANASLRAVEYKLQTLLHIGTNLTADKVVTNFTIQPSYDASNQGKDTNEITIPITMEAHIEQLHIPSPVDGLVASIPLDFKADGVIKGEFFRNWSSSSGEIRAPASPALISRQKHAILRTVFRASSHHVSHILFPNASSRVILGTFNRENSRLTAVTVDVDCDALLSSMISQAALVVGAVVDVTNEAWARTIPAASEGESSAAAAAIDSRAGLSPEKESHHKLPVEMANVANLNIIGDSTNNLVAAGLKRSASSSEDDTQSYNSFENATHIVDYVFGELDESVMALPHAKKQRVK